jgi:predicted nucleic acid-binding protein
VRLVADANVLLSAVIGGRAALALRHDKVEQVFTSATAHDEVLQYLPSLAKKKRLNSTRCSWPAPLFLSQ